MDLLELLHNDIAKQQVNFFDIFRLMELLQVLNSCLNIPKHIT